MQAETDVLSYALAAHLLQRAHDLHVGEETRHRRQQLAVGGGAGRRAGGSWRGRRGSRGDPGGRVTDDEPDLGDDTQQFEVPPLDGDAHERLPARAVVLQLDRRVHVIVVVQEEVDGVDLLVDDGVVQRQLALVVVDVRHPAGRQQALGHRRAVLAHGEVQRCVTGAIVSPIHVGAGVEEHVGGVLVVVADGLHQRSVSPSVLRVHVGPAGEQDSGQLRVALPRREVQRRVAVLVPDVKRAAGGDEPPHGVRLAAARRLHQRRLQRDVARVQVHRPPYEHVEDVASAVLRRVVARRVAERVARVRVRSEREQLVEAGHLVAQHRVVERGAAQDARRPVDVARHVAQVLQHAGVAAVGDQMDGAEVEVALFAHVGEFRVQIDAMLFDQLLQPRQVVVEDKVVQFQSTAATGHRQAAAHDGHDATHHRQLCAPLTISIRDLNAPPSFSVNNGQCQPRAYRTPSIACGEMRSS